ncbi:DUF2637 domain-containing protein [Streptomyces sp. NPDC001380]|uniref:DUF2637 domain-containing protein n=1 Tax=Streptomyces sp. NPDC001380 TaxID=3364566 RepID=UPI00367C1524
MRLSDIPPGWAAGGVAALVAAGVLLALLRGRGEHRRSDTDSWERSEERRRRKEMVYGIASYALLFCCAAVAAALSFHGLVGFGVQNLNLSGGWEYLVPFGLDGAAMFCSVLAVREASHGDAAFGSRLLVWLFAFASAWFNWVHAPRGGGHDGAPQFFSGMSVSAAILFDRALKQTRKAALREQGLVPRPLPQIRTVRWLRAPRETYAAWSLMLLEGVRSLDEAVEEVRDERRERAAARERQRLAERRERAEIRALSRAHGGWVRPRGPRGAVPVLQAAGEQGGYDQRGAEPAIAASGSTGAAAAGDGGTGAGRSTEAGAGAGSGRPGTAAAPDGDRVYDLSAEDDTLTLPRLDSLEEKLRSLEQQLG